MAIFLFIVAAIAGGIGAMILLGAKSAVHEIEAGIMFLIGAVFTCSACIVDTIKTGLSRLSK